MAQRYRYTGGQHHRADGSVVEQGETMEPTDHELETIGERGHLEPVSEFGRSTGADIGLRALPMTDAALEVALDEGLEESDFEGVEPEGANGQYLKSQVEDLL